MSPNNGETGILSLYWPTGWLVIYAGSMIQIWTDMLCDRSCPMPLHLLMQNHLRFTPTHLQPTQVFSGLASGRHCSNLARPRRKALADFGRQLPRVGLATQTSWHVGHNGALRDEVLKGRPTLDLN